VREHDVNAWLDLQLAALDRVAATPALASSPDGGAEPPQRGGRRSHGRRRRQAALAPPSSRSCDRVDGTRDDAPADRSAEGDALVTAQLAGIMAAKRTSELIPLCHPLPLSHIEVSLAVEDAAVEITGVVETTAQTGVEMEALTAVSVAALTVYDMVKAIDSDMSVSGVTLVEKTKEPV
jgi:cyclic pyranopterin phosphate synthase